MEYKTLDIMFLGHNALIRCTRLPDRLNELPIRDNTLAASSA